MKRHELYDIVWLSRPLMQAAEACVDQGLSGTNLTVRMRAVLEILHANGDLTVPDIAKKLEIKRQYVQLMVNETLICGFTAQRQNPRHKRSALLTLTDQGRELIEHVVMREMQLIQEIGADLDDEDVSAALRVVRVLTDSLKGKVRGVQQ